MPFLENLRLNWFQAKAQIKRKFICWRYACCLPFDLCLCCLDFTHLSIWFFSSLVRRSKDLFQEVMRFRCREGKGARGDISYSRSYLAASSQRKPNFIYTKTPSETSCPTLSKYCVNMHMILSMTLQGYGLMRLKMWSKLLLFFSKFVKQFHEWFGKSNVMNCLSNSRNDGAFFGASMLLGFTCVQ